MRGTLLIAVLICSSLSAAFAQTVEDELQAEVARFVQTVNNGDPDALAELYIQHRVAGNLGDGNITRGWSAIDSLLALVHEQVGSIHMTVDSLTVMPLGRDAGVARFRFRWVLGRQDPQAAWGAMTLVFVKTPAGWRVAHDHAGSLSVDSFAVLPAPVIADFGPAAPIRRTTSCVVSRIVDGDTFECRGVGRVRPIGMDTPELSQAPYGAMATQALNSLMPVGTAVELAAPSPTSGPTVA
jgi:ketosteroid isomerase-like protein